MKQLIRALALVCLAACSASVTDVTAPSDAIITIEGPLRLTVTDAIATPGFLFIAASVATSPGTVSVSSTRYGSLCSTAVSAHATVTPGVITIAVTYSERFTVCTQEIRAIAYVADLSGVAAGAYDVHVVHTGPEGQSGTVLVQHVTVI